MSEKVLKDVTQIGIVTRDLDRSIRAWSDKYGVGPWQVFVFDSPTMTDMTVDGQPRDYGFRAALAMLGTMMLEVIEPLDEHSIYAESLRRHGGTDHVHHILCSTDGYKPVVEHFRKKGVVPAQTGHITSTGASFSYLASDADLGFWLEVIDRPPDMKLPEPDEVYPPDG